MNYVVGSLDGAIKSLYGLLQRSYCVPVKLKIVENVNEYAIVSCVVKRLEIKKRCLIVPGPIIENGNGNWQFEYPNLFFEVDFVNLCYGFCIKEGSLADCSGNTSMDHFRRFARANMIIPVLGSANLFQELNAKYEEDNLRKLMASSVQQLTGRGFGVPV